MSEAELDLKPPLPPLQCASIAGRCQAANLRKLTDGEGARICCPRCRAMFRNEVTRWVLTQPAQVMR